jgi:ligand-binding sensor domain-containing protein
MVALLALIASSGTATARTTSAIPFSELVQREWSVTDGIPPFAMGLAIDRDGFLWMSAATGIYRFDGASFTLIREIRGVALPPSGARPIRAAPDGSVWIGYRDGRIAVVTSGAAKIFDPSSGLPAKASIGHITFGADGVAWASTSRGLFFLRDDRWHELHSDLIAGRHIIQTTVDSRNRVWIVASHGLFVRQAETGVVEAIQLGNSLSSQFAESPDGQIWLSRYASDSICRMRHAAIGDCFAIPRVGDFLFDRDGTLWGNTTGTLFRIQRGQERLTTPNVNAAALMDTLHLDANEIVLDKNDQLWVIGDHKLTRFRASSVTLAATPSGAIAPASGGEAWVASFTRGLSRVGKLDGALARTDGRAVRSDDGPIYLESGTQDHRWQTDGTRFESIPLANARDRTIVLDRVAEVGLRLVRVDRDRNGAVWVGAVGPARLFRGAESRFTEIALPKLDDAALLRGIAVDTKNVAWLAVSRNKEASLFALEGGAWRAIPADGLDANALALDLMGRPWIGTPDGEIARLSATGGWVVISDEDFAVGAIAALAASRDAMWVGGSLGLAAVVDDVVRQLRLATAQEIRGVTGLVADAAGNLWVNGADGLLRIARDELRRALSEPNYRAAVVRVDRLDGVNGYAIQRGPYPSLAQSDDGRVWFTTSQGLYSIVPADLKPAPAPRSFITDANVDDQRRALVGDSLVLPPRTQRVTMRFTAPHLVAAERIQFRYRLRPFEQDWQYAGSRREAVYTNLAPGSYSFEVQASDDHGAWLGEVASLALEARPAFVQTGAFLALCVVGGLCLLVALYGLRMRQVSARLVAEGNARHAERERIARELHDTLLQGMQGLILKLHGVARRGRNGDGTEEIAPILDEAEAMLEEGRDRVHRLNGRAGPKMSFIDALSGLGERLTSARSCKFEITVSGSPMDLGTGIEDELLSLAQEAVSNAVRHSRCRTVRAEIRYDTSGLALLITDDGRGIDPVVLQKGRPGHFGLTGMRQRAALLGASLEIHNEAEGGVRVAIRLPASAYARRRGRG